MCIGMIFCIFKLKMASSGDLILTVGAGDIYRAGEKLLSESEG